MRKSSFFTFCFALIPGAGQMYLGMMKKGLAVMLVFWGMMGVSGALRIDFPLFLLPVIWCYSFFETLNALHMTELERRSIDDKVRFELLFGSATGEKLQSILKKRHTLFGAGLVTLGIWLILRSFLDMIPHDLLPNWLWSLSWRLPTILVYIAIILLGVWMVRGGKKKPLLDEEFVAYKGDRNE